jgi:hypothetical protein
MTVTGRGTIPDDDAELQMDFMSLCLHARVTAQVSAILAPGPALGPAARLAA